jgi:hypothetical protein
MVAQHFRNCIKQFLPVPGVNREGLNFENPELNNLLRLSLKILVYLYKVKGKKIKVHKLNLVCETWPPVRILILAPREELVEAMEAVLWNQEDGIWYDYDRESQTQRRIYAASNLGTENLQSRLPIV